MPPMFGGLRRWLHRRNNQGTNDSMNSNFVLRPPPPSLPGSTPSSRRVSLASASLLPLSLALADQTTVQQVPIIPVAAFEIVPGAEDSDAGEDHEDISDSNESEKHIKHPSEAKRGNGNVVKGSDESTTAPKTNASDSVTQPSLLAPPSPSGLFALAAILQRRRGSSATVSSWLDDESIYDEAEVRSALPSFALPIDVDTSSTATRSAEPFLQHMPPKAAPAELDVEIASSVNSGSDIYIMQERRVVVIALDSADTTPLKWILEHTILQPKRDLVVVVNVRPSILISPLHQVEHIAERIEHDNKKVAHGFLKNQIQILFKHQILAKGLAMRGDPRHEIVKTVRELNADMVILGPHTHLHKQTLAWMNASAAAKRSKRGLQNTSKVTPSTVASPAILEKEGLGSVSDYVVRHAPCAVLVAKDKNL
ncbi:hypothetical protein BC830DRAFT_1102612 [Chytriomyces sp. MP71]|nr:hypothetical protein BC830DRAFT_1102612 [Chytriomyces sp. MP71]